MKEGEGETESKGEGCCATDMVEEVGKRGVLPAAESWLHAGERQPIPAAQPSELWARLLVKGVKIKRPRIFNLIPTPRLHRWAAFSSFTWLHFYWKPLAKNAVVRCGTILGER